MLRLLRKGMAVLLLASLGGCQSSLMVKAGDSEPMPAPGKALMVFLRPSSAGRPIQSSVYDTKDGNDTFIGVVSAETKVAYEADPGDHLFMVVGENASFMIAHMDAGKTYYALVSPRADLGKAQFSLLPVHTKAGAKYSVRSANFQRWMDQTDLVRVTPQAMQWYDEHAAEIREKKFDYLPKWHAAAAAHRAELTLVRADGY